MAHWTLCEKCHRVLTKEGALEIDGKYYCPEPEQPCAPKKRKPRAPIIKPDGLKDSLTGG